MYLPRLSTYNMQPMRFLSLISSVQILLQFHQDNPSQCIYSDCQKSWVSMVAQSPQKHSACTATQPKIEQNTIFQVCWSSAEVTFPIKHQSFLRYFKHWTDSREPEQLWIRMSLKWLIVSSIITEFMLPFRYLVCVTMWASSFYCSTPAFCAKLSS